MSGIVLRGYHLEYPIVCELILLTTYLLHIVGNFPPSSFNLDDVSVILGRVRETRTSNLLTNSTFKNTCRARRYRFACVKCNATHIMSKMWIEIDRPNYTMLPTNSQH